MQAANVAPEQVVSNIGGLRLCSVPAATVQFAGLVVPGEFQFNFVVPGSLADGDQPITASHSGSVTQPGTLITIQH